MDENLTASDGVPGTKGFLKWPAVQLARRFYDGFLARSWEKVAAEEVEEDLADVDRIAAQFPQLEINVPRVKDLLGQKQPLRQEQQMIRRLNNRIALLLSIAVFIAAPFVSVRVFHAPSLRPDFLAYAFGLLVALFLVFLPFTVRERLSFPAGLATIVTALVTLGYVQLAWSSYRAWIGREVPQSAVTLSAVLSASVVLVLILFLWAVVAAGWSENLLSKAWDRANPEVAVVSRLVRILHMMALDPQAMTTAAGGTLRLCGTLWMQLDRAAEAVRRGMPKLISPLDPSSPAAVQKVQGIAAGLEDLKEDVACILSRRNSPDKDAALKKIAQALDAWAAGEINELPRANPESSAAAPKPRMSPLRRVVAAVAPFVILMLVKVSHFGSPEITGPLTTFSILWLVSVLLRGLLGEEFDKNLESTLNMERTFKGGGK